MCCYTFASFQQCKILQLCVRWWSCCPTGVSSPIEGFNRCQHAQCCFQLWSANVVPATFPEQIVWNLIKSDKSILLWGSACLFLSGDNLDKVWQMQACWRQPHAGAHFLWQNQYITASIKWKGLAKAEYAQIEELGISWQKWCIKMMHKNNA